jgi:type I restriction enzyme S subunit
MSDEWVETTLKEVAIVNPREGALSQDAPFITMADVQEWGVWAAPSGPRGERGGIRARGGDTLVARITPCLENGKIAMVPQEYDAVGGSTEFIVLRAGDQVLPEFLFRWATSTATHQAAVGLMTGTTGRQRVSANDLTGLPLLLPPLPVQRRIVDLMAHLDNHLANLRAELETLYAALDGLSVDLLSASEKWARSTLGEVSEVRLGRMLSRERATGDDLAPYIRNANVQWGGLDLSDLKLMNFPDKERKTYALLAGDILVCEGGDPGRAVLLQDDLPGIFYQKALHRVRAGSQVLPGFLFEVIWRAYRDGGIADLCTNTTIKHLTAEKFRTLEVWVPPLEAQEHVYEVLVDTRTALAVLAAECESVENMRSSLVKSLVSGALQLPTTYDSFLDSVA